MRGQLTAVYSYVQPRTGREAFQRVRFEWPVYERGLSSPVVGHGKDILYRFQCDPRSRCDRCGTDRWHWQKPPGADGLLYRLPEVIQGIATGDEIWWTEGEKDADALASAGVVATSHHQGAEVGPTRLQARRLRDAARIVLVMDRDQAGAYDVTRRRNLLVTVGVPEGRIAIVRARGPVATVKDAYDHLKAGWGVGEFVPVDPERARAVANKYRTDRRGRRAYRPGAKWSGS